MSEIIPAIIAKNFEELQSKIKLIEPYVNWAQIDIMDGKFVLEKTWPYDNEQSSANDLKKIETVINLEAHLMVEDVENEIEGWLGSGVKRILVHWEAIEKLTINSKQLTADELIKNLNKRCKGKNVELGLVLNLETPIDALDDLRFAIYDLRLIQLMSIEKIGHHGEEFDEKVIHKIGLLRQKYPNVKISIDGGVNENVIKKIAKVGVDNFIVGSAVFNSENIEETIKELKESLK